jgi:hypothetical protein
MFKREIAILIAALFLSVGAAYGANEPLKLTGAHCLDNGAVAPCRLSRALVVSVEKLDDWVSKGNDPTKLVVALNGMVLKGLKVEPPIAGTNELQFELARTTENRDNWNILLSRLHFTQTPEPMNVSIGPDGQNILYGPAPITWKLLPEIAWVVWAAILLVGLLVGFLYCAKVSNIIRDPAPGLPAGQLASYSLARSQMAWWFFLVVTAYVYIWIISGDMDTLTDGVLILTGISAGAGVSSMIVDSSKQGSRKDLEAENTALGAAIPALQGQIAVLPPPANLQDLQTALQQKQARVTEIAAALSKLPAPPGKSEDFLKDILRGDSGIEFHRFQMAAWTIVLGLVFIREVYGGLAMPNFSATLLSLMGISSGTYLGFKIPDTPK